MATKKHRKGKLKRKTRGFQQDVELAMGSDPVRAIVELVTNADDAYVDTPRVRKGKIRIEVERHYKSEDILIIKDRAIGMSADELVEKLGEEGGRSSGFERGQDKRGLLGRGAKDVVHFGPVEWESVRDGQRSRFRILYRTAPTDQWELEELGRAGGKERGTKVTLQVQPRFTVPRHDTLRRHLTRHMALRPILSDTAGREVVLTDLNQGRHDRLVYEAPKGKLLEAKELEVRGYPGQRVKVEIWESGEGLDDGYPAEYWRHSLLVRSGRAAYEVFDGGKFAREPWAPYLSRLFGTAEVPGISQLIREYDDQISGGKTVDARNPVRLVKRDRTGLVATTEHPFVEAIYAALEGALRPHLERLKKESESDMAGSLSEETRNRLDNVGRLLGKLLQEEESEGSLEGAGGNLPPIGLSLIPSAQIAEPDEPTRVLIRYRPQETNTTDTAPEANIVIKDESGNENTSRLALKERQGYFSRSLTVAGRPENSVSGIEALVGEDVGSAIVEWQTRSNPPVETLQFEHAAYSVRDGGQRTLWLLAPWDLTSETDASPSISISGDSSISLVREPWRFGFDEQRGCGVCLIRVKGRGVGSKAKLVAALGEAVAEAEVSVTVRGVSGIEIKFEDLKVAQRALLKEDGSVLRINMRHPSVARYAGKKKGGRWPGLDTVHFNTMLAEIITWAFSRFVIQDRRQERQDPSRLFYEQMQLMDKWLPRVHGALVPVKDIPFPGE